MSSLKYRPSRRFRTLTFDIENRPLTYLGPDYTTGEVTAIAASWDDEHRVHVWLLGRHTTEEMLAGFPTLYEDADRVTWQYRPRHDLPVLNGARLDLGLPPLDRKMTQDTKADLIKAKYLSLSQENLGAMFGLSHRKEHMNQNQWREANRLTPKGLKETRRRVTGDVKQHKELRRRLLEMGAPRAPRERQTGSRR